MNDTPLGQLVPRRVSDEFDRLKDEIARLTHQHQLLKEYTSSLVELTQDLIFENGKLSDEIDRYELEYDRSGDVGSEE